MTCTGNSVCFHNNLNLMTVFLSGYINIIRKVINLLLELVDNAVEMHIYI